jgi:hypothetical protein
MGRRVAALPAVLALAAAACGGTATEAGSVTTAAAVDDWAAVVSFAEAVASNDWEAAQDQALPGSPADRYVDYRQQVEQAQQQAGAPAAPSGTVQADAEASSITVTVEGDDAPTFTWSDITTDQGLVSSWTGDQGGLDEVLVSPDSTATAAGADVRLTHAYQAVSGDLLVVVQVSATTDPVTPDQSVVLLTDDGTALESGQAVGPSRVDSGETGIVVYALPGGSAPGTVVYEVQNDVDAPVGVELPLP